MKKTQSDIVLQILRERGQIDNFYCMENKITIRLGAIIYLLKERGLIELDDDKCGFIEGTKNYRYVVKPIQPKRVDKFYVNGEKVAPDRIIW